MERLPLDRSVLDSALERMDIADIAQATIRQSGDIARIMETQTGMEFLHLEMGVPGLPPEKAGVEAECRALQSGVASQYPNMFGIPELKQQTSRFIRAFLDVGVAPQGCIPTVGSMQGSFTAFGVFIMKKQAAQAGIYAYLAYAGQCGQRPCQSFGLGKTEGARGAHAHSA